MAIADADIPAFWEMGRIIETIKSKHSGVRQVLIKTASRTYRSPVSKLAVLKSEKVN